MNEIKPNERIEYNVQWYDSVFKRWRTKYSFGFSNFEDVKRMVNSEDTRIEHRIIMRTVTDWCEVKEGEMK